MNDVQNNLWFKRKTYGWGWVPVTWQGWVATSVYVVLVSAFGSIITEGSPAREVAFAFVIPVLILTTVFMHILYKKGESPRWQWGEREEDRK